MRATAVVPLLIYSSSVVPSVFFDVKSVQPVPSGSPASPKSSPWSYTVSPSAAYL